ncbi:MAG: T9SS type A sorting domain-containing protein [Bacteroidota bacterium]
MSAHYRFLVLFLTTFCTSAFGQSISFDPSTASPSSTIIVDITGVNTNFSSQTTCALLTGVENININIININGPSSITAEISFPFDTKSGNYSGLVYESDGCGGPQANCTDCFFVEEAVIEPSPSSAKAGTAITFEVIGTGTDFQTDQTTCAVISNGMQSYTLDALPSSPTNFSSPFEIPCDAPPGTYNVTVFRTACSDFSYTCEDCFIIEEADPGSISISPNVTDPGVISVHTITGTNTCFASGASLCVEIANGTEVYSFDGTASDNGSFTGSLDLPCSASNALYDLTVYADGTCSGVSYSCNNCFGVRALNSGSITISPSIANPGVPIQIAALGNGTCFDLVETTCMEISNGQDTYSLSGSSPNLLSFVSDLYTPSCDIALGTYDVTLYVGSGCTGYTWTCTDCLSFEDAADQISLSPNELIRGKTSTIDIDGICTDFLVGFASSTSCAELTNGIQTYSITGSASGSNRYSGTINLPSDAPSGTYDAVIYQGPGCDGTSWTCTNCFSIKDSISINPNMGLRGTNIAISLDGVETNFSIANTSCVEVFNGTETYTIIGTASSANNFTGTLNLPGIASSGVYDVKIYEGPGCDGQSWSCTNCFNVIDSISISPASAVLGQVVQVTISGLDTEFDVIDTDCAIISGPTDYAINGAASNSTLFSGTLIIPNDGMDGSYDLTVYEGPGCFSGKTWTCSNCFTIEPAIPLPAELLAFDARLIGQEVALSWSTATEQQLASFEIERSTDIRYWSPIGQVSARGSSNQLTNYQMLDPKPFSGLNYYRLKQIGFDGQYTYSPVVTVELPIKQTHMSLFPNPVEAVTFLAIDSPKALELELQLSDFSGRQIRSIPYTLDSGTHQIEVDLRDLLPGVYYLNVRGAEETEVYRLLKL